MSNSQAYCIIKNNPSCLIIKNQCQKYYCKTFHVPKQLIQLLQKRSFIHHPNLIQLHHMECQYSQDKYCNVKIVYQLYCKGLEQCGQECFSDQEIVNTFQPVIQAVQQLIKNKCPINNFSLKNVVFTQDQSIKFIDSFFVNQLMSQTQLQNQPNYSSQLQNQPNYNSSHQNSPNYNNQTVYQNIAQTIYKLAISNESMRSWKSKMKIIKQRKSTLLYNFLSKILSKAKIFELQKSKKIKKVNLNRIKGNNKINQKIEKSKQKIENCKKIYSKQDKNDKQLQVNSLYNSVNAKHQGKENKLFQ